jgi:antitoxin component of MazEF toxin-antitoxin module
MVLSLVKLGNSRAIRIPNSILKQAKLSDDAKFEVRVDDGTIILEPLEPIEELPTFKELFADWDGVPPEKFDWGAPVGKELM